MPKLKTHKGTKKVLTVRKNDIKITEFKEKEASEIKLRKLLSEKIKKEIFPQN